MVNEFPMILLAERRVERRVKDVRVPKHVNGRANHSDVIKRHTQRHEFLVLWQAMSILLQ